jgi:probable F420-dependent oxidoreductase
MGLKIGLGFPTSREGQTYAVSFIEPHKLAPLARRAEELGFYSIWGNDHLTPPNVIRSTTGQPANFYEPIITFATLANVTQRLRFMLSVLILPLREPVLLAKQIATLDRLTDGRVMLGLGLGAYRDEIEAVQPGLAGANRGVLLDECLAALRLLFEERRASYEGQYIRFSDVELAPKPVQRPFPLLLNASSGPSLKRAARLADGWIAPSLPPHKLAEAGDQMHALLVEQGRDPASVQTHQQVWLCFGRDQADAETKLKRSQHFRRILAHHPGQTEAEAVEVFRAGDLLGTADEVTAHLRALEQVGVNHLGVIPVAESMDELLSMVELFAERVLPTFR